MPMTKAPRYIIQWDPRAEAELEAIHVFDSRPIVQAVRELAHQAETETRNRKPLLHPIEDVPQASWEVRVVEHRVLYEVKEGQTVRILRVILKGRQTTGEAVSKKP
jgi:hypothetical protein